MSGGRDVVGSCARPPHLAQSLSVPRCEPGWPVITALWGFEGSVSVSHEAQNTEVPSGRPQTSSGPGELQRGSRDGGREPGRGLGLGLGAGVARFLGCGRLALSPAPPLPIPQVLLPLCGLRRGRAALPDCHPAVHLHPILH